jgi:ribosomal protein S20
LKFTDNHVQAILTGRKTMTRVIAQQPKLATRPNGTTYTTTPFVPRVGMRLPFTYGAPLLDHGAGTETWIVDPDNRDKAYIIVTAVPLDDSGNPQPAQRLDAITLAEAKAEGHNSVQAFMEWWVGEHDKPWVDVRVRRAGGKRSPFLKREMQTRFAARWAAVKVWPMTFCLDPESVPLALAPIGRGDARGYYVGTPHRSRPARPNQTEPFVPQSVADEGEPIAPGILDPAWNTTSTERHRDAHGAELSNRLVKSLGRTMAEKLYAKIRAGHDITADVAALQRAVEEIEHRQAA